MHMLCEVMGNGQLDGQTFFFFLGHEILCRALDRIFPTYWWYLFSNINLVPFSCILIIFLTDWDFPHITYHIIEEVNPPFSMF